MTCPKCQKHFEKPNIGETGEYLFHPFVGEIAVTTLYCPHCGIPVNAYKQAQRMKSIRKTFHRPTKVVDKNKKKKTRAQRKKDLKRELE